LPTQFTNIKLQPPVKAHPQTQFATHRQRNNGRQLRFESGLRWSRSRREL